MPFLRINRDKRGYEHTFLMHAFRRRGQARSTILYWFRTPPNVKVGRAAIDEEAIRALEDTHPDLIFDWPRILQTPTRSEPPFGESRAARPEARRRPNPATPPRPSEPSGPTASPADIQPTHDAPEESAAPVEPPELIGDETSSGSDAEFDALLSENRRLTPNSADPGGALAHPSGILNSEQLFVLRGRHAELQARLSERITDPATLEALREQAAKLDPDAWVTAEEVRQHLETYELVYQALRTALGESGRRRSRRGGVRHRRNRDAGPKEA